MDVCMDAGMSYFMLHVILRLILKCFDTLGMLFKKEARPEVPQIITVPLNFLQVNWIRPQAPQKVM
jgi:hypothetical protein